MTLAVYILGSYLFRCLVLDNGSFCRANKAKFSIFNYRKLVLQKSSWREKKASTILPLDPQLSHNRQCPRQASPTRSRTANRYFATFTIYERI